VLILANSQRWGEPALVVTVAPVASCGSAQADSVRVPARPGHLRCLGALGVRAVSPRARLRVSLVMSSFEMAMPIVGLLLGHALGMLVGDAADYAAVGLLALLGAWMLLHEDEDESDMVGQLASGHGLVLLALGLSISLDELEIGLTIGLLHLSLWLAILLIGAQALLFPRSGFASVAAGATVGIAGLGLGLGTAGCLVLGGIGLVASVVAFAAWARKQIVRWGELIRPLFPTPPGQGTPVDRLAG
jgi:putative Mn2+ efflux pump MntP